MYCLLIDCNDRRLKQHSQSYMLLLSIIKIFLRLRKSFCWLLGRHLNIACYGVRTQHRFPPGGHAVDRGSIWNIIFCTAEYRFDISPHVLQFVFLSKSHIKKCVYYVTRQKSSTPNCAFGYEAFRYSYMSVLYFACSYCTCSKAKLLTYIYTDRVQYTYEPLFEIRNQSKFNPMFQSMVRARSMKTFMFSSYAVICQEVYDDCTGLRYD